MNFTAFIVDSTPILTFDVNRKAAFSLAGKLFNLLYSK